MKVSLSSVLPHAVLCSALTAAAVVGSVVESEAGTRFSNRKSSFHHRGTREDAIARAAPIPAHGVAYLAGPETPVPPVVLAEGEAPKRERKGFFARVREKREQRQVAAGEERGGTPDGASSSPTLTARIDRDILARASTSSTRVVVDISRQRAYLLVGGKVAVDTPVSTARPGKHTPLGTFHISQRVPTGKVSTIYGVEMPYWMRLDNSVFGMHAGYLPGYPASAGCIRLPSNVAPTIFSATQSGTQVSIYSSWNG